MMKFMLICMLFLFYIACANEAVITIPKTGTNLLLKLIFLIDQANGIDLNVKKYNSQDRTNKPLWLHSFRASESDSYTLGPTEKKLDWIKNEKLRLLILVRDPRALTYSLIRKKENGKVKSDDFNNVLNHPLERLNEMVGAQIFNAYSDLNTMYRDYMRWSEYDFTYLAHFENLVGPSGGGCRFLQVSEIMNISNHLGKPVSHEQAEKIADRLFGETNTFQKGQIDSWKQEFSKEQKKLLNEKYFTLLDWLGYRIE